MLKRNSFVFKVAYGLRFSEKIPQRTNICRLFWLFLRNLVILWPVMLSIAGVLVALLSIAGGMFGKRMIFKQDPADREKLFANIQNWPLQLRGYRILPIHFIGAAAIYFLIRILVREAAQLPAAAYAITGLLMLAILIVVGIVTLVVKGARSETWALFRAWLRAKKEGVCWIIEIEPKPADPENQSTQAA